MSEKLSDGCLCVREGLAEAEVVDEQGCVCGCVSTTVNRYPALFRDVTFTREQLEAIIAAGKKR